MRELTETDLGILEVARKLFLDQGIMKTEMKDIARKMGCSRSTLYRHFTSKDQILMLLAANAVSVINVSVQIPEGLRFGCGFDALEWQMNSLLETLISHVDEVTFLRDFDCLFSKGYPSFQETGCFDWLTTNSIFRKALFETFLRGVEDHSIKPVEDPNLAVATLGHCCLAMAQRIMPREQLHIEEHGYGQEMMRYQVKLILTALRQF